MSWRRELAKLGVLFRRSKPPDDLAEEIRSHLEMEEQENLESGMPPEEAHYAALRRFGNVPLAQERSREMWEWNSVEGLWQDLRFGLRMLWRNPGFTAVAVVSLALGTGANTAIFSLVNAILLRSLPVPNPQELRVLKWSGTDPKSVFRVWGSLTSDSAKRATCDAFSYPTFSSMRNGIREQAEVLGFMPLPVTVRAKHEAFVATGSMVSDNFFSALGVKPLLGRLLSSEEEQPGAAPAAVITYSWWAREFNLDPGVLGQTILFNGHSFSVVGVLPRDFPGVRPEDDVGFYVPMSARPQLAEGWPRTSSNNWWVQVMARLKPTASEKQFQAGLDFIFDQAAASIMKEPKVRVEDGRGGPSYMRGYYRRPLMFLLGVVGMVLLVACANLAGLSLARGAARQHEMAVRAAVGAGRWRLMRQMLTESLLLALLSGGLGVLLAVWTRTAISQLLTGSTGELHYDTSLDLTVLGFTLATVLLITLLSGLLPAWGAARVDPVAGLKGRASLRSSRLRTGRVLVAGQIALSTVLVAGAGLYVRTLVNLVRIDPGFDTEKLLLFRLTPATAGYQEGAQRSEFYDTVQRSLAAIPGVRSVALTQFALLGNWMSGGRFFTLPGHPMEGDVRPEAHRLTISETFFTTMSIPVLLGRGFTAGDVEGAPKVIVVNGTFVRKYLPGENPVGQTLHADGSDWQIVGVCGDAKYTNIKADVPPTVYFSFRQDPVSSAFFALRTALPPIAVATAARKAVAAIDPNVPLADITTQVEMRDKNSSQERLFAMLCSALAGLAVLLSCIGLYGLMAYNVARRTGEIGIRMALGATRQNIAGPILREALLLGGIGVAVGVPAALALSRLIKSQLYGVEPNDPFTLVAAVLALLVVAVGAAWIPARRAMKVDPMVALTYE